MASARPRRVTAEGIGWGAVKDVDEFVDIACSRDCGNDIYENNNDDSSDNEGDKRMMIMMMVV